MTTDTSNRSVLLIGASQRILDDSVTALCDLGYTAQATSDFVSDITGRFDVTHIDLVSLGGQVPPDRKDELKQQIGAINPRVIVLDSLAGIPGLIASQVQEAFTADRQDPAQAPAYTLGDRSIRLTLQDPAAVKVTVWWRTSIVPPDPKSDSLVLLDTRLASGHHTIPVPDHVFLLPRRSPNSPNPPQAVFASVQVEGAIYNFSIAAGQYNSQAAGSSSPAPSDSQATDRWGAPGLVGQQGRLAEPGRGADQNQPPRQPSSSWPSRRGRATKPPN